MRLRQRAVLVLFAVSAHADMLYNEAGVLVVATETPDTMEFCVYAPEPVSVSIMVDRNQNGAVDSRVDTTYSLTPAERICTVFLLDRGRTTFCGGFSSEAQMNMRHERGWREYTYIVPKSELSFGQRSAWVVLEFYDSAHKSVRFVPRRDFQKSIHIRYELN
jgi:hypothetical protein